MLRPEQKVISALASLQGHPDFETIKGWLVSLRSECHLDMESTTSEVALRQRQGYAQALRDILETSESAQEVIRRNR